MQTGLNDAKDEQGLLNLAPVPTTPMGMADAGDLTPAKVLKQYDAIRAMPPAAYLAQVPAFLQLAEEALYTFPEPLETHDELMRAYRALADEYGAWMGLQGKHGEIVATLERIEAALAPGGTADPADVAWLDQVAGEATPAVPAPIARLQAQAHAGLLPPAGAAPLSSKDLSIPDLDLAALDRALTEAMGELATPARKAAPSPSKDAGALGTMFSDTVLFSGEAPAVPTASGSVAGQDATAPGLTAPAQSTWWQRWYRIGTARGSFAQKMQDLRGLQNDLKILATGQAGAGPTVADELNVAWRHRVTQALIASGYLEALSEHVKAAGSRPFSELHGITTLKDMCNWCDLLADEVIWLVADAWWETFVAVATRTAAGSRAQDSVYTANPQLIESVQTWIRANQKRGEATVSRFMR